MRLPITAWTSITHRASGVFLFIAIGILLYMLDGSLKSPEGFAAVQDCLDSLLARLVLLAVIAGVIYHALAGIKHLIMDFGIGESMAGGILGARLVIVLSVILTVVAAGVWVW